MFHHSCPILTVSPLLNLYSYFTIHVPPFLTLQRMTTGPFAAIALNQRKIVSNLVRSCAKCLIKSQLGRRYQHSAKDPRILQFLDQEFPLYYGVTVDLFTDLYVLNHARDRRKPSYPVSVLAACCLVSQDLSFYILDGNKTKDVIDGLKEMTWRYRCPQLIIADHASQFVKSGTKNLNEQNLSCDLLLQKDNSIKLWNNPNLLTRTLMQ